MKRFLRWCTKPSMSVAELLCWGTAFALGDVVDQAGAPAWSKWTIVIGLLVVSNLALSMTVDWLNGR